MSQFGFLWHLSISAFRGDRVRGSPKTTVVFGSLHLAVRKA
ncbi:MAG: hypothetical protein AAFY63_14870 [Cyanobacteria bacterium J06643_13]